MVALVKANEPAMATPLALEVVKMMTARKAALNDATLGRLTSLVEAFDVGSDGAKVAKLLVSAACCKLATAKGIDKLTASAQSKVRALHAGRARDLSSAGKLSESAKHFAVGGQPLEYAGLLERWAALGYAGEKDLFGARAVLHVLAASPSSIADARTLHGELTRRGLLGGGGGGSPLDHFLALVFELLDLMAAYTVGKAGAASAYDALLSAYRPCLFGRDGKVGQLAQRVGQVHFGWVPPPSPMQGLMSMFKG